MKGGRTGAGFHIHTSAQTDALPAHTGKPGSGLKTHGSSDTPRCMHGAILQRSPGAPEERRETLGHCGNVYAWRRCVHNRINSSSSSSSVMSSCNFTQSLCPSPNRHCTKLLCTHYCGTDGFRIASFNVLIHKLCAMFVCVE